MTNEARTYLLLELTTALGTLGLAFAQVGPLQYNSITAGILFVFIWGVHLGLLLLSFPEEFRESGIPIRYLLLYGIPAFIAFAFACYACLASWSWTGIPRLGTETGSIDKEPAPQSQLEEHAVHWSYEPGTGPADWGAMDPAWNLCAEGRAQSPIDLTNAKTTELPHVELHLPSGREVEVLNQEGVIDALDNGHTIQVNTKTGERMTVGDKSYALLQFHLHSPSEHTVDGKHFPMEMHFVHQAEDGALAVIAVLIEEGAENRVLAPLWKQLAEAPGTQATVQLPVKFADRIFTTRDSTGLFHYEGSLTTPPCSEGVQWFVRRTPTQLSKAQIAEFTAVYDHNNRPVQALNDRVYYLDETPDVTIR